ncbi:AAA family ATPase [Curtobacterium sp. YC1]|uniref:AAA family ATPase n=1 Tax=Curtobacterium sp. YC1 TaxID=2795488 RepID=UPI001E45F844|nr:ATP-binding protein [Curtobacterium sp. YC1]
MVAIDEDRTGVRRVDRLGEPILTTAAIYGPNASGKTNLLAALNWLREAIQGSLRYWDEAIPIEPFASSTARNENTSFALEVIVEGILFEYLLELNSSKVQFEALYHYPEGRRRKIYVREKNELSIQRGLGHLSGTRSLLTDRSLALSIMRRFDDETISGFGRVVLGISSLGMSLNKHRRPPMIHPRSTLDIFDVPQDNQLDLFEEGDPLGDPLRRRAMSLLRLADLGVADVEIERDVDSPLGSSRRRPKLIHAIGGDTEAFSMADESAGTRTWFSLIGPLLHALDRGRVVLFDELEANLHPVLTAQILKLFANPGSNPRGAQLIFTSHDTNLLAHLNRDEVWLTQKNHNGETRFAALSDFAGERVRKSVNLESGYISGRFGALPDVNNTEFLRDLGLIG